MNQNTIAEIVTFKLTDGTDAEGFVKAAEAMTPFLQRTGGFVKRCLSCDETGLWTDHLEWASMDDAMRAAKAIADAPEAAAFMDPIELSSTTMRHAKVALIQG